MKPKRKSPLEKGSPTTRVREPSWKDEKLTLDQMHQLLLHDIERYRQQRREARWNGSRQSSRSTGRSNSVLPGQTDLVNYYGGFGQAFMEDVSKMSYDWRKALRQLYQANGFLDYVSDPFLAPPEKVAQRRVGGVMTDHATPIPGRRFIATTSTSGSPPVSTTSTIVQGVTAYQTILENVASVDGNKKNPNPHRFRTRRLNYGSGLSYAGDSRNNTVISGTQAVAFGLSASFTDMKTFTYNKALSKMYEQIRGDLDLSVDAFQARQAGVMLNQRFKQGREVFLKKAPLALVEIVKIAKRMKRSNPRDWGSLWLEWTYGWKPLADSIYGATENMIRSCYNTSQVSGHPVRCGASENGDSRTEKVLIQPGSPGVYNTKEINSVYQCRFNCFYAVASSRLNSIAGYTSLNPVSIAWELVPYSFVADWFVDIGGYLRNMESSLLYGSDFVGGYVTERSKQSIKETTSGGLPQYSVTATGSSETKSFQRTVLGSSPGPRPPGFNPKLGTSRLISAAALLSQHLHSFKR